MTGRAVQSFPAHAEYGWSAAGKSTEEIAVDIRQTKYRLDADLRELKEKLARVKWPALVAAAGLILLRILRGRR
jgi:hypothetical protein